MRKEMQMENIKNIIETAYNWLRYFTAFVMVAGAIFFIVPIIARSF